jgi:hypothetical protein
MLLFGMFGALVCILVGILWWCLRELYGQKEYATQQEEVLQRQRLKTFEVEFEAAYGSAPPRDDDDRQQLRSRVVKELADAGRSMKLKDFGRTLTGEGKADAGLLVMVLDDAFGIKEGYARKYEILRRLALRAGFGQDVFDEAQAIIDQFGQPRHAATA